MKERRTNGANNPDRIYPAISTATSDTYYLTNSDLFAPLFALRLRVALRSRTLAYLFHTKLATALYARKIRIRF